MMLLLGAIGWGLLTFGAVTHIWHHERLRRLLAMHLDHERGPALALTLLEAVVVVGIAVALLVDGITMRWFGLGGTCLALGFVGWIARLLFTGSSLPCACSFSDAPTTIWSLVRAICVLSIVVFAFSQPTAPPDEVAATLTVGLAIGGALFVLPEAISWPESSRALMARVDAYAAER